MTRWDENPYWVAACRLWPDDPVVTQLEHMLDLVDRYRPYEEQLLAWSDDPVRVGHQLSIGGPTHRQLDSGAPRSPQDHGLNYEDAIVLIESSRGRPEIQQLLVGDSNSRGLSELLLFLLEGDPPVDKEQQQRLACERYPTLQAATLARWLGVSNQTPPRWRNRYKERKLTWQQGSPM